MKSLLKYYLAASLGLWHFGQCSAQSDSNLIRNWSFEELKPNNNGDTICPNSGGHIYLSKQWKSADGSVDYFNSCSNEDWPNFGVPNNLYGYQEAFEGVAYAHLGAYSTLFDDAREFLMQELETPLRQGQGYSIRFRVNLTDSCNYALSGIGALFTVDDTRYWQDEQFLDATPQVENLQTNLLDDKENWMMISGQFVANGSEKFLTIGCFNRDTEENIQQVSNNPQGEYNWDFSSYYIDGVELYEDSSIGISAPPPSEGGIKVFPNPSLDGSVTVQCELKGSDQAELRVFDMSGRQVYTNNKVCGANSTVLEGLSEGLYQCILVINGKAALTEKLVILRE